MMKKTFQQVNKPVRKKDAMNLLLGKPAYVDDVTPTDFLVVKVLRSPHAHALIEDIDVETAKQVDGIEAIYTYHDVPQKRFTMAGQTSPEPSPHDRLILDQRVRFVGDAVAIVAGINENFFFNATATTEIYTLSLHDALPNSIKSRAVGGHPSKKTFQAIRIELNHELDVLNNSIDSMIEHLNDKGRFCIITFHSLEDRIVKVQFKNNENPCTCPPDFPVCVCGKKSKGKVIPRKPLLPSEEELEENKRAKSAKLRVFERRR
mgnify:CR=1 FL=1